MTAADPTRSSLSADSFAPGGYDGPPITLPAPLPATHGVPVLDPYGNRVPMTWTTDYYGNPVPMPKDRVPPTPPTPPRDLTPQPLIDRTAQRILASGACAVGIGYGTSLALNAAAGLGTGLFALAAGVIAWKLPAMGKRVTNNVTNNTNVTNDVTARWWGRASAPTTTTTNTSK